MITNIKLFGMYNIGVNDSNNIDVRGTAVSIKDIPFVRYKFDNYGVDEINYIKKSMEKFATSTHMLEFTLNDTIETSLESAQEILSKVAKYIYIEITQEDVNANTMNQFVLTRLAEICRLCAFDRIMMVDKTDNLDMVTLRRFIKDEHINKKIMVVCSDETPIKTEKLGSTSFVPSVAGLLCTSYIINDILKNEKDNYYCNMYVYTSDKCIWLQLID